MKRKRKKYQPKEIKGLTWSQKLGIEGAIEFAIDRAIQEESEEWDSDLNLFQSFQKLLALFRKKTKHMRPPRQRRRRKAKVKLELKKC